MLHFKKIEPFFFFSVIKLKLPSPKIHITDFLANWNNLYFGQI